MQLNNLFRVMLKKLLLSGDSRSVKAKKNVLYSMGIKGIDSIVQLLLVPATLGYLNQYEYGIWLTLNSILLWINSFDIGLGNGLRNQLAIAVANNDKNMAKALVSTAFGMIAIIMLIILAIGSIAVLNIDWYNILGAEESNVPNLQAIVYVSFALFCVNFMVKFVGNVYLAMQMPSINNLMVTSGHLLSLIIIFVLTKTTDGSLYNVAFAFSISPIFIYLLAYPITFVKVYSFLRPALSFFKKEYLKDLFSVGVLFFVLQISGVVLFAMSNIVISKLFGPDQVTPYNVSYRYLSLAYMLLSIIVQPIWTAVTDANAKNDTAWIDKQFKKTERIIAIIGALLIIMVVVSPIVYFIWIGNKVEISWTMTILTAIYIFIIVSSTAYSYFLNGLGKLYIQAITTVSAALLFIPLSVVLSNTLGVYGIVLSMIVINSAGLILNRIQVRKLINSTASGLWNK